MIYFARLLQVLIVGASIPTEAQTYSQVDDESSIVFTVKNFGLNVDGSFSYLKGTIRFDPHDIENSFFDVAVESKSLDTGIDLRDKHLKKKDYLNVEQYPLLLFKSIKITSSEKPGNFSVAGNITIKNITKEIQFPFAAEAGNTLLLKVALK